MALGLDSHIGVRIGIDTSLKEESLPYWHQAGARTVRQSAAEETLGQLQTGPALPRQAHELPDTAPSPAELVVHGRT